MPCPFSSLSLGSKAAPASTSKCPFSGSLPAGASSQEIKEGASASAGTPGAPGSCPRAAADGGRADASAEPAVCPFGFSAGTGNMPAPCTAPGMPFPHCAARCHLSPCTRETCTLAHRCRGLYYDCVRTSCGHYFCRACIQPFSDCLLCGADVAALQPEPRLQGALQPQLQPSERLDKQSTPRVTLSSCSSSPKNALANKVHLVSP